MLLIEIIFIGIGVAMDAFTVAVCKGLSIKKVNYKVALVIASYFGIFQALMPLLGYFIGTFFKDIVIDIAHFIACILLSLLGIDMLLEVFNNKKSSITGSIRFKDMIIHAIATSIDALTIGMTFAFFNINLFLSVSIIGIITFILSFIGVYIGKIFGNKYDKKAQLLGAIILILMGLDILLEHLY